MNVRIAKAEDAEEIQSVILESAQPHRYDDFDDKGWENFLFLNRLEPIRARLKSRDYLTFCYILEGRIVGILGIFKLEKIDQLFVHAHARKIGLATELWSYAKEMCIHQGNKERFWVKSSSMAIPVYKSFGFKQIGDRKTENGISFYPLELVL